MPTLSTFDMTRFHSNLARAKRIMAEGEVHAIAQAEGPIEGVDPKTLRAAAKQLLALTDLVVEESGSILRMHERELGPARIERIRQALAEDLYVDFDFGHRVETQSGWAHDGADRMSRPVFLDIGGPETVQVEFGLRFAAGSAEVLAYGTDIDAPAPTPAETPEI